jgi:hypothetical protein
LSQASGRTDLLLRKGGWGKVAEIGGGDQSEGQEGIWLWIWPISYCFGFLKAKEFCESFQANGSQISLCSHVFPASADLLWCSKTCFWHFQCNVEILGLLGLSYFPSQRPE